MAAKRATTEGNDHEEFDLLAAAVEDVQNELAGIRRAVDEIRDDVTWATRNNGRDDWRPIQPLTSMPLDPLAPDWSARLNRFTAADITKAQQPTGSTDASRVVDDHPATNDDDADQLGFCCDFPALIWIGDPDFPGVACANCGYLVAESGSVVMSPAPDVHGCELPPEPVGRPQRELF